MDLVKSYFLQNPYFSVRSALHIHKGGKLSEGVFNFAPFSKKRTKSLTNPKGETFKDRDRVWVFLRIGQNFKYILRFSHLYW